MYPHDGCSVCTMYDMSFLQIGDALYYATV